MLPAMLDLTSLRALYAGGSFTPLDLVGSLTARLAACDDPAIFIATVSDEALRQQAHELVTRAPKPGSLPLWGIPFAVKDNIDVAGLPTTAGCPSFAYQPMHDAFAVARLRAAGGIVIGKTNLDQFATGLNGTRSPYGAPRCVFDHRYISGGSSSGSAVAVAAGLAAFALGTDTAGSGRVPAALNNIVGVKPTPGRISTNGLVPACRSLDVITIFSGCVADGIEVRQLMEGFDPQDPFSRCDPQRPFPGRLRIGVQRVADRVFHGDADAERLFDEAVGRLSTLDVDVVPFDFQAFQEAAKLLYGGPWVAERLAALDDFMAGNPKDMDPVVAQIVAGGRAYTAVDAFRGRYALEELRRATDATWAACDALMLPTTPTTYTVEAMQADPVALNANLGHYTNFANLFGLAAIAVPAGFRDDGLPFGITVVGPGSSDDALAGIADRLHRDGQAGMGRARAPVARAVDEVPPATIEIAVVGAHLSGLPLNHQLVDNGGRLVRTARTMPDYRLYALPKTSPPKPGLVRTPGCSGPGIETEIWSLPPATFARFVAAIPAPLGIGRVAMADGSSVSGFLCESWAVDGAEDVTAYGGWRSYLAREAAG